MASTGQHRLASALAALGVALAMTWLDGLASGLALLAFLCLLLALIWFPEPLGEFVGGIGMRRINRPSPPGLVRALGWVGLVAVGVVVLVALARTYVAR